MSDSWTPERDPPGMSIDVEGVTDSASNSKSAIAAAMILLLGLFAPIEPRLAVFSLAAAVLALASLVFSRRTDFTAFSRRLAAGTLLLGTMLTIWAGVITYLKQSRIEQRAVAVATDYMKVLAEGQLLPAIQMVGLPPVVERDNTEITSASQKAVQIYLQDYSINQVRNRGREAKWETVGVVQRYREGNKQTFKVRFFDRAVSNSRPYDVELDYIAPYKYAPDKRYRWIVGGVQLPSN